MTDGSSPAGRGRTSAAAAEPAAQHPAGSDREEDRLPSFSVVMPQYNAREYLGSSVPSVLAALDSYGKGELIVVDNGSTDGSYRLLREKLPERATLLSLPDGTVSAARNAGAAVATGDFLSFIDADCVVPEDYFFRAARIVRTVSPAAAGSWYRPGPDPGWVERTWYRLHARNRPGRVQSINGGNLVVDREAFRSVGGFDENLVTGEDAALCQALRDEGYELYEAPSIVATHLGNPDDLSSFFRQQVWHGIGMFGTVRGWLPDRPTAAVFAHILALIGAGLFVFLGTAGAHEKVITAAAAVLVVPTGTVLYRWTRVRRLTGPVRAVVLYQIYYLARAAALALLATGRAEAFRRR